MTLPNEQMLQIGTIAIVVPFRVFFLVRGLWSMPLRNGPGFFLGIAVPPGFYDSLRGGWLRRYHMVLSIEHLVEAAGLAAILLLARWSAVSVWMGASPLLLLGTLFGFLLVARQALGGAPAVLPAVAVSLEQRRLGDYISWPAEAAMAGLVVFSWVLLLRHGVTFWKLLLLFTWLVLGLLPGKMTIVRAGWPIPGEQIEAHRAAQEASRRYGIRCLDWMGWLFTSVLVGVPASLTWHAARPWITGCSVVVFSAIFLGMMVSVFRGQMHIDAMVRGLRPCGSWATPFRRTPAFSKSGLAWFTVWFGGMVAMLLL